MKQTTVGQAISDSLPGAQTSTSLANVRCDRPRVEGKFLFVGTKKLYVRGVTYGTFQLDEEGNECLDPEVVERDFAQMAAIGVNAVRTYTAPPRWLLDTAQRHGLYVLFGLAWNQDFTFFDEPGSTRRILQKVRTDVRRCAGHPAVLAYTIGNEIPTSIVRWYGHKRVARFLEQLYRLVKAEDPQALGTYANYPSTEYLDLPFLDFISFNVYLESREALDAYLARLQNLAGDRPLILAEIGLDSRRSSLDVQARVLDWQIRTAFSAGCAGTFVFAWTDEWHVSQWVDDWDFGLTDRARNPKPALAAVRQAYAEVPFPKTLQWPHITVVVCSYNGARTIGETLAALMQLEYSNYDVIVVDDGSTDETGAIAERYDVRVIRTPNRGLSRARNTGLQAAEGEIVVYLDDDAFPDPHWLNYLAAAFLTSDHAAIGGPNITPKSDGLMAQCIANAPGNPVPVLITDREAEHIPGCNLAVRKDRLAAIGGFDPQFRAAGDDVDVCWRLQAEGWTLGYAPAAMVWHHRRDSMRTYWRQQRGYGVAEALLERKWPAKYNVSGSLRWSGRIYDRGLAVPLTWQRARIYQGDWGSGLFQSLYQPAPNALAALPLMPEWYLVIGALGILTLLGTLWSPLLWICLPLFVGAFGASVAQAVRSALHARYPEQLTASRPVLLLSMFVALLHLIQPLARLVGHLRGGLSPWRSLGPVHLRRLRARTWSIWTDQRRGANDRYQRLESVYTVQGIRVRRADAYRDEHAGPWDLEVHAGLFGAARLLMLIEEQGMGRQRIRIRAWPRYSMRGLAVTLVFAVLAALAVADQAWVAAGILVGIAVLLTLRIVYECAAAMTFIADGIEQARKAWE